MQVLSSLSSIPFYAPSAGFAPTNSADVSAIASAYQVVSATATQLYAGTAYVTSVNDAPLSAARAGNAANAVQATSAWYDGTGRLLSSLPDEATVSSIASAYAESAASGKLDKTAQVVTAIGTGWNSDEDEIVSAVNGCVLSADEARYAGAANSSNYARYDRRPNVTGYRDISSLPGSAEVSAIASSYQVVSATGTKLYNGTYYLTSVNDNQLSAKYAVSASSATAAFYARYDRQGGVVRYLSSLPGSAEVSAIASAYAESAANGKQDALTFGYNAADQISSIDGSALGGMDEAAVSAIASAYAESAASSKLDTTAYNSADFYSTSNPSGFIDSAYVDSAVSSKADSSALSSYVPYSSLEYNTASAISGINGSALAAGSTYSAGEGINITDDVISVEAPVDIVAGPGIVIDNPDGNTLRVSMAADYEVELFSGTAANTNIVLNEALDNFERIKIYAYWKGTNTYDYYGYSVTEIYTSELSVGKRFTVNVFCNLNDSEFYSIANFSVAATKTQLDLVNVKRASLTEQLVAQNDGPTVYKVIGVHRIANN